MKNYKSTTEKLILEYHESQALQKLNIALGKIQVLSSIADTVAQAQVYYTITDLLAEAGRDLEKSQIILSDYHDKSELDELRLVLERLENQIKRVNPGDNRKVSEFFSYLPREIESHILEVNSLNTETQLEIEEYERRSTTAIFHGKTTILFLGIFLIVVLTVIGVFFIRSTTKPIDELLSTTRHIAEGDHNSRVKVASDDEFRVLANSFNIMLDVLEATTISKQYLDNIINNMFDLLIVTDRDGIVMSINKKTSQILGYSSDRLLGMDVVSLFNAIDTDEPFNNTDIGLINFVDVIKKQDCIVAENGVQIPALISCTELINSNQNSLDGYIIVVHDLTETRKFELEIEQNRMERVVAINEAQEQEKMRIAIDLHDGLGQILTAISYAVQNLRCSNNTLSEETQLITKMVDVAIHETKNMAYNLMPMVLKDFGLIVAIQTMVDRANVIKKTSFQFSAYDFNERLDSKLEKALFRICQEALNNIQKHADAKNAYLQLYRTDEFVTLVVDDDGKGFDPDALEKKGVSGGLGLVGIKERVKSFNGFVSINSSAEKGTEIIIEIPFIKSDLV